MIQCCHNGALGTTRKKERKWILCPVERLTRAFPGTSEVRGQNPATRLLQIGMIYNRFGSNQPPGSGGGLTTQIILII